MTGATVPRKRIFGWSTVGGVTPAAGDRGENQREVDPGSKWREQSKWQEYSRASLLTCGCQPKFSSHPPISQARVLYKKGIKCHVLWNPDGIWAGSGESGDPCRELVSPVIDEGSQAGYGWRSARAPRPPAACVSVEWVPASLTHPRANSPPRWTRHARAAVGGPMGGPRWPAPRWVIDGLVGERPHTESSTAKET